MEREEKLIGFDAREMWTAFDPTWTPERKDLFLLRTDIDKPLSTDEQVWNSVFDVLRLILSSEPMFPPWWESLDRLRSCLSEEPALHGKPYWVVASTRFRNDEIPNDLGSDWTDYEPKSPSVRSDEWQCLGLDVSDESTLSGLMNCGYDSEESRTLRRRWGPKLNERHLFDDMEQALAFRTLTDDRVREHAPFFVYGLWLVERVNGA